MSRSGRINHLVKILQEEGFYPPYLPFNPGKVNKNVLSALEKFKFHSANVDRKSVSKVVNAFRNISPKLFRGFGKFCDRVTTDLVTAVDDFIAEDVKFQSQLKKSLNLADEEIDKLCEISS
ncbi:MAG: hypothetical protein ACD_7C00567G0002 [uncultured bacterium]|nr:MAG: hypothetical protein ACD_7C00567G0002 [uncultured bacterium]